MTNTLTPAEFMAMPSDPEADEDWRLSCSCGGGCPDCNPQPVEKVDPACSCGHPVGCPDCLRTGVLPGTATDLLESISASLATIAAASGVSAYLDQQATDLARSHDEIERQLADAEALNQVQADLIERVLEIVKPSTSKVANSVREALGAASFVEAAAPSSGEHNNELDAPPASDAGVEEWRAYARSRGYTGPDVDKANRSQIRTMLGVEHPGSDGAS